MNAQHSSGSRHSASIGVRPAVLDDADVERERRRRRGSNSARHAAAARGTALYMRNDVIIGQAKRSVWPIDRALRLLSSAWPSAMSVMRRPRCQNRIVSSSRSRPGFSAGDDLAELGVQVVLRVRRSLSTCGAQRAERQALAALAPVVDDHLVHDVGQRELDRAHRAVGHDEARPA